MDNTCTIAESIDCEVAQRSSHPFCKSSRIFMWISIIFNLLWRKQILVHNVLDFEVTQFHLSSPSSNVTKQLIWHGASIQPGLKWSRLYGLGQFTKSEYTVSCYSLRIWRLLVQVDIFRLIGMLRYIYVMVLCISCFRYISRISYQVLGYLIRYYYQSISRLILLIWLILPILTANIVDTDTKNHWPLAI